MRAVPLGRAETVLTTLAQALNAAGGVERVEIAGGVRRYEPVVKDLAIIVAGPDADEIVRTLTSLPLCHDVRRMGPRRAVASVLEASVTVDIADPDNFGLALLYATGSTEHVTQLVAHARANGWTLSASELRRSAGGAAVTRTESSIYSALGLADIEPELRHGTGEVEAAARGRLPQLVRVEDIRGDLHLHSTWSDGRDPVERMVRAACALGYEYVAITDHSPSSFASRTLSIEGLREQHLQIAQLQQSVPGITILRGAEVDILPDGRLDFPDSVLAGLDIVLASLHESAGHSGARLTERYLSAIAHPLVNVITHPANRIVGRDEGYELDVEAICQAARETGTLLEVDGAPIHLDMDGVFARQAVDAGVTISISSDCHRAEALGRQMRFGVGTARRGWVGPRSVLNSRPLDEVRAAVARKRTRSG